MAEAIGIASGLLTLATFALDASISLVQTISSFKSHGKRVRDLLEELEALNGVLSSLADTTPSPPGADLSNLKLPLLRCGRACEEFKQEIMKCSSRSDSNRTSFRDWAKLRYMDEDIDGFRRMISGYQMTINIALTDATLRKATLNGESLESYKNLVMTATDDLETRLEIISERLEKMLIHKATDPASNTGEVQSMKEEQLSTQKCLEICARLSEYIDQVQYAYRRDQSSGQSRGEEPTPEKFTNEGLQGCRDCLRAASAKLEQHMKDVVNKMVQQSKSSTDSEDVATDLERLQDEWETARRCVDICHQANSHLRSDIENYALGDAIQYMISTNGIPLTGRNRGLGWRTRQVGGHLSEESLQQLSKDMLNINLQRTPNEESFTKESGGFEEHGRAAEFKGRHGKGFTLSRKSSELTASASPTTTK